MRSIRFETIAFGVRGTCPESAGCRGVALIAVLWMTAVLTILVASMAYVVRVDALVAGNLSERTRVTALLDGALRLAASDLANSRASDSPWFNLEYEIDGVPVTVEVAVSNGFININMAEETLLQDMFIYGAGLSENDALTLAQRVIDWRDTDDEPGLQGAETDAYKAAGVAYRPRNAPFQRPDDLLQVLGLSPAVYDSIRDLVTTAGMHAQVNPQAAPERVLFVLGKGNEAIARQIVEARDESQDVTAMTDGLGSGDTDNGTGMDYRLQARIPAGPGVQWQRTAWMAVGGGIMRGNQHFPWGWHYTEPVSTMTLSSANR